MASLRSSPCPRGCPAPPTPRGAPALKLSSRAASLCARGRLGGPCKGPTFAARPRHSGHFRTALGGRRKGLALYCEAIASPENVKSSDAEGLEKTLFDRDSTSNTYSKDDFFALLSSVKMVPHPDKVDKGGEDAYFLSSRGGGAICVVDGVGGWAEDGVDPALYSKEFSLHAKNVAEDDNMVADPLLILENAHKSTKSPGAATAILALLDDQCVLRIANLGDCGLRVVRNGEIIFASQPLMHFFDCPFQFGSESSDSVADAKVYSISVREGDVIVIGSDGLFDNVFDSDICLMVEAFYDDDEVSVQRTASALAALAFKNSQNALFDSPYTIEAREQGIDVPLWQKMLGKKLLGGKPDDITVAVGKVVRVAWSDSELSDGFTFSDSDISESDLENESEAKEEPVASAETTDTPPEEPKSASETESALLASDGETVLQSEEKPSAEEESKSLPEETIKSNPTVSDSTAAGIPSAAENGTAAVAIVGVEVDSEPKPTLPEEIQTESISTPSEALPVTKPAVTTLEKPVEDDIRPAEGVADSPTVDASLESPQIESSKSADQQQAGEITSSSNDSAPSSPQKDDTRVDGFKE